MCGRYVLHTPPSDLKARLGLDNLLNIPPRYNCGPIQRLPIIVKNRMGFARWGFQPEWSREDDPAMAVKMINARSETAFEKPAFRESWARARRCLIPADGFYEWAKATNTGVKQPYYIKPGIKHSEHDLLLFAGLWSKVGEQVSFTILTKQADENLAHLHHRAPVMIEEQHRAAWFDADAQGALALIENSTTRMLNFHKVGLEVGKIANDHAGLIESVSDEQLLLQSGRLL